MGSEAFRNMCVLRTHSCSTKWTLLIDMTVISARCGTSKQDGWGLYIIDQLFIVVFEL